ncbi:hypothetical protein BLOT_013305 [Blomia tropicalis]|nr:hypothetical protein BLOT_013305 [Blomia tropicalis]
MMETIRYFLFDFWEAEGDPRIADYPLFRGGPWTAWSIIAFYVYFVTKLGPALMKNREPMTLKSLILGYNLFMIAVNSYFFYEIVISHRFGIDMNMFNFERSKTPDYSPKAMHIVKLSYLFLLSKYLDLIETVFFVLRKKHNQVSSLHVYHHSAVPILVHMFAKISSSGGPGAMFPFLNTFIHIIMYLYYSMAAMGLHKYLWWKKYLTQLQLAQFVIFGIYGGFFYYNQKGYPPVFNYLGICQPLIFFYMFYSFYRNSYNKRMEQQQQQRKMMATNGIDKSQ